jgi:hypothetical protein
VSGSALGVLPHLQVTSEELRHRNFE